MIPMRTSERRRSRRRRTNGPAADCASSRTTRRFGPGVRGARASDIVPIGVPRSVVCRRPRRSLGSAPVLSEWFSLNVTCSYLQLAHSAQASEKTSDKRSTFNLPWAPLEIKMSTTQYNARNPGTRVYFDLSIRSLSLELLSSAVKRLMKEAQELREPTELYTAQPLDVSGGIF